MQRRHSMLMHIFTTDFFKYGRQFLPWEEKGAIVGLIFSISEMFAHF